MIGLVVSTKQKNTATVLVRSKKVHPLYKKSYQSSKKYLADDLIGVKMGDIVQIEKTKPISLRKYWKVIKIIGKNIQEIVEEELKEQAAEIIGEVMPEEKESGQGTVDSEQTEGIREKPVKKGKTHGTA